MFNPNTRIGVFTLIAAFMLAMMPLPDWAQAFRPDWVTLVLIYWTMALPASIGVTVAWFAGLMLDVSHGALLGQHALGLVLVIYIIHAQHQRLRVASMLQQSIVIFFLLLMKQALVLWVDGIMGRAPDTWLYFMPSLTSALIWPWVHIILRDLRRKFAYKTHY
ncbi:MAG: rod shape-determining protein MreD [Gammaproteobacteria bacterium]|nr:rod shape-determining protein MreD [Gammaproteobacteria bacterium]